MLAALAMTIPSAVWAEEDPQIEVGRPPSFSDTVEFSQLVVDVYYGGKPLGQAKVTVDGRQVRFDQPSNAASLLAGAGGAADLVREFSAPLPANEQLVCGTYADPLSCGRLVPASLGVILDRNRFRLDLFTAPALEARLLGPETAYLATPSRAPSLINAVAATLTGSQDGRLELALQNGLTLASGNARLHVDFYQSSATGPQADQAFAEIDTRGRRYRAGLLFAPGGDLINRRKLLGAGVTTQLDTRSDREELTGTPLNVSLGSRARVEILRDGRLLSSQTLDAGNRQLDTSMLPQGTYDLVLRVKESASPPREERRFFAKNSQVAPLGTDLGFLFMGLAARETSRRILAVLPRPYLTAGYAHRWSEQLGGDAQVILTDRAAVVELGSGVFLSDAQLRVAALASSNEAYGALLQASFARGGAGATFDLRHVHVGDRGSLDGFSLGTTPARSQPDAIPALRAASNSFTQATGYLGLSRRGTQFGIAVALRQQRGERLAYSIGPNARVDIVRRGPLRLSVESDAGLTERGSSGFLGLSLTIAGPAGTSGTQAGLRFSDRADGPQGVRAIAAMQGARQFDRIAGGTLELSGGIDRSPAALTGSLGVRYRGTALNAYSDVLRGESGMFGYSLGARTNLVVSDGRAAFQGSDQQQSAVLVEVGGGRDSDSFEVLVDDRTVAILKSGQTRALPLPPYRTYAVRLRPQSSKALAYDARTRSVSLFPGTVTRLAWTAHPLATLIGRLVEPGGVSVAAAFLTTEGTIGESDSLGFFQIEAPGGSELTARRGDGTTCTARLPQVPNADEFTLIGDLVCRPELPAAAVIAAKGQ